MSEQNFVSYAAKELDEKIRQGEDLTDWERVRSMTDEEIEANIDYEDEGVFDLSKGYAASGPPVPRITEPAAEATAPPVAPDVVAWFRERHPTDYEARINAVLRDFVAAESRKAS